MRYGDGEGLRQQQMNAEYANALQAVAVAADLTIRADNGTVTQRILDLKAALAILSAIDVPS